MPGEISWETSSVPFGHNHCCKAHPKTARPTCSAVPVSSAPISIHGVSERSITPTRIFTREPARWVASVIFPLVWGRTGGADCKAPSAYRTTVCKPSLPSFCDLHLNPRSPREAMHREIVAKQTKQIFIIPTTLTIVTHVACGQPTKCLHCLLELSTMGEPRGSGQHLIAEAPPTVRRTASGAHVASLLLLPHYDCYRRGRC